MNPPPSARGLPLRVALPVLAVVALAFLAIMWYLLRPGTAPVAEQGDARIAATPAPAATDPAGTVILPQTGTGPAAAGGPSGAPAQVQSGNSVGGGPPAPVAEELGELRARLQRNPKDLAALVQLAQMEYTAGKYDKAADYYRRALALDPANPDTRTAYASVLHLQGHDLDGLAELHRVLRANPSFPPALYTEGVLAQAIGRRSEAITAFRHYLKAAPGDRNADDARSALRDLGAS